MFALQSSSLAAAMRGVQVSKSESGMNAEPDRGTSRPIDTARAGCFHEQLNEFNRRIAVSKRERRSADLDLNILGMSGRRVSKAEADHANDSQITDSPLVRLLALRTDYPAVANAAPNPSHLQALADAYWNTLDDQQKGRFRAAAHDVASSNGPTQTSNFQKMAADFGEGVRQVMTEIGAFDTAFRPEVRTHEFIRKQETRAAVTEVRKADPTWPGSLLRSLGMSQRQKADDGRAMVFKSERPPTQPQIIRFEAPEGMCLDLSRLWK
jgi:hypothetical protein